MTGLRKFTTLALCALALSIAACGKKSDNGNNANNDQGKIADVPGLECVQGNGYGGGYGPYRNAGFQQYPWQQGMNGFRNCPIGTIPVCGNGVGLMCAPAQNMRNYQLAWYGYQQNNGFAFCGYNTYQGYYNGMCGGGYQGGFGRACIVGTNTCGGYARCQPMNFNSPVGVCTSW